MSLLGPLIELNQLHNSASVEGAARSTMPTGSDLSGGEIKSRK